MRVVQCLLLCLALHCTEGAKAEQCWQGVTFSETIVSPSLKSGSILRVPEAPSSSQCAEACCELPGCDLAWLFERRCYVLSCLRPESCQPRQRPGADSHVTFVRRGPAPALMLQSLVRGQPYPAYWRPLSRAKGPAATLKDLAFLDGARSFDEPGLADMEYPDSYRDLEDGAGAGAGAEARPETWRAEQKETSGYLDWPVVLGRESLNLSEVGGSQVGQESLRTTTQSGLPLFSLSPRDIYANGVSPTHPGPTSSSAMSVLQDSLDEELPKNMSSDSVLPSTAPPHNHTTDSTPQGQNRTSLPTDYPPTVPSTAPPTPAAPQVRALLVSAGDPVELTLPKNSLELEATVSPEPQTEGAYSYEWNFLSSPTDHRGKIKDKHSKSARLSGLSKGVYVVKVMVTGDHVYGEGLVNVTVKDAVRVNQPPRAIALPLSQDVLLPASDVIIDGSQSTDDTGVRGFHWEQVKGPPREPRVSADTPMIHLPDLEPGDYTFRLTVMDSDGLIDSTTATVRATLGTDLPPVADTGPSQTFPPSLDRAILCRNQSSDDHVVVSYLWTLSPASQAKEVTMQGTSTPHLQLSGLRDGEYIFQLTLTDSAGHQASATVTVRPERNRPPMAVAGPEQQLTLPVKRARLDGSDSTDDGGIVAYRWDTVSGPPGLMIEDSDKAVAMATGFTAGRYTFRLTVEDQQGAMDRALLNITVREGKSQPIMVHTGGRRTLVLPNSSLVLWGNVTGADPATVSYLWVRDIQSPAAGDVLFGSEQQPSLHLANLVEGTYLFQLRVSDAQGHSGSASANVEVLPDPLRISEVELELRVALSQVSQRQRDTLVGQLAALLHVSDADVFVRGLHARSEASTVLRLVVRVQGEPMPGIQLALQLRSLLLRDRPDLLLFRALRVDTTMCLLDCSDHGRCDPFSKRCVCEPFWMENPVRRLLQDRESNCEWSVLYVIIFSFVALVLLLSTSWACVCCCRRRKRTKVRKKTKYTILDNMDDQEHMELRPKYSIKHRSTEHNSSLMMSESEFESEQDTIFARDRPDRSKARPNGTARNGVAFSARPVDS